MRQSADQTPSRNAPDYRDAIYINEAEVRRRIGISRYLFKTMVANLEPKGFPKRDPLFGNKRCWPAVRAFLLKRASLPDTTPVSVNVDKEDWD